MYIATFFTHFGAVSFNKSLENLGQKGIMMPVPRVLSASCGVCIKFDSIDEIDFSKFDDLSEVYLQENGEYKQIYSND